MVDDAVGTFRLGSGGLTTLTGTVKPTFTFEIGSTLGSIDRLDLATMGGNAVIAAGTKVSFAGLSSATTLAVGNYTFLTTAANGLGPVAFTLASSTVTVGSTTYNLSLANSTATQEILTISGGTISNNSVIAVAPVNLSFGRVLATAIGTRNLTVSRASGTSNTGATAAVTGGAAGATLSSTASGAGFITGSQNWVINVGLNPGLGAHSDTVAVANTGNDGSGSAPGGPGQGNSQLPINIAVSGSVLALRSVTAAPLLLGRQLAATNLNSLTESVTFNSSGTHADTTDVTVDGNPGFNGASNTLNKSITGQNAVISASGTFYTASVASGETGLGDTYAGVPVSYTATPLALRSVTATPVALGRQLATTHLSGFSRTVTLVSSGSHNDTTDVTVDGSLMFNGTNNTQNLVISGQSGVIAASGTFYSAPVVSDETGLGDTYGNVAVSYTATPLALRLVTSATVSLGRQLAATNLNNITRTVTFNSTGTHAGTTDVTVDGSLLFNGVGNSLTKMLTGQNAVIGANGTYYGASVVSGESGLGDTYGNVAVSYTATPLALRSVTGATVLLGRQLATANLNSFSKSVTFNSSGLHGDTTDVTVDGSLVFNGGSNVMSKTIAGQNAVIGAGGSYYSAPVASGESGLGDTYGNVTVSYMATPLALRSVTGTVGDLGRVMGGTNLGTLSRSVTFDSVGTHEAVTDVMVDGTLLFTGGSNSLSKNVTGPNETVGAGGVFYSAPVLSGEVGLGDTYANVTVGYTATPLQDRVVAADTVDFGLVHVGAAVGGATTLRTTGDNSARTAISVGNASGGGFSLAGGANPVFNDAAVTDARTLAGTLGTAGAFANVAALTLLPGTEAGIAGVQIPVAVEVRYSADVFSGSARWNGADSGSWGTAASASWIDTLTASIHAAPGTFSAAFAGTDRAVFNAAASGTVNLDGATPSLAAVTFSGGSHTIAAGVGAGALTLKSDAGPATVTVSGVIQSITAPVVLGSDVTATVTQAADFLTWSGGIDGAGKTLTKDGDGMLTLAGPQNYAALEANQGVTNLDSALGTGSSVLHANAMVNIHASQTLAALVIGDGATVTFGDGLSFAAAAEKSGGVVPEPGALALLLVGVLGVLGQRRR